jgi:hypothetical protein
MKERNCPNCGAPIELNSLKCPYCDTPYSCVVSELSMDADGITLRTSDFTESVVRMVQSGVITPNEIRRTLI